MVRRYRVVKRYKKKMVSGRQLIMFKDPGKLYLDFTKVPSCSLRKR